MDYKQAYAEWSAALAGTEYEAELERIAADFRLTPMEDPFSYIKGVQASFDGGKLHYTDEYYDTLGLARPDRREPASQGFEFEAVVFALEKE